MKTVHEWLRTTKAGDVMTKDVAVLRPRDRLADAISLFLREQISGAPVVDEQGTCIGVLSTADVVSFEEKRAQAPESRSELPRRSGDIWDAGASWWHEFGRIKDEIQPRLEEGVTGYMTRDIVGVTEDAPLGVVIRQMLDSHVHRVLVLDRGRHLQGIISTVDVLAAALRAGRREHAVSL